MGIILICSASGPSVRAAARRAVRSLLIPLAIAIGACTAGSSLLGAQAGHEHHDRKSPGDTARMSAMQDMPARPFGIPMTRMGSGTAWLPDASAMRAWHFMAGPWVLMGGGGALLPDDQQGSPPGGGQGG